MVTTTIHTRQSRLRGDRGAVTVELAVLFPVFLVLLLTAVQASLWWHARNLTLAAAREGADVGRTLHANDAQAASAARSFAEHAGAGVLSQIHVDTAGSTTAVLHVTVSGTAPRVLPIPGLSLRVRQSATAGREIFTTPDGPP